MFKAEFTREVIASPIEISAQLRKRARVSGGLAQHGDDTSDVLDGRRITPGLLIHRRAFKSRSEFVQLLWRPAPVGRRHIARWISPSSRRPQRVPVLPECGEFFSLPIEGKSEREWELALLHTLST